MALHINEPTDLVLDSGSDPGSSIRDFGCGFVPNCFTEIMI